MLFRANEFPVAVISVHVFLIGLIRYGCLFHVKTAFAHRCWDVSMSGGGGFSTPSRSFQNGGAQPGVDL